jgi:hypothetical protein
MSFILLITGQVLEVSETRTQVINALSAQGATAATGTVKGQPMTFRASGVLAVAETLDQVSFAMVGVLGQ